MYSVLPGGDGGCDGRLPDLPWEGGRKKMVKTIMMMVMKLVKIVIIDHRSDIMAPMIHDQEDNINGDSDDIHGEGGCGA